MFKNYAKAQISKFSSSCLWLLCVCVCFYAYLLKVEEIVNVIKYEINISVENKKKNEKNKKRVKKVKEKK